MEFVTPDGNGALFVIDLGVYGLLPLLKTAYTFTDRCYLHLQFRDATRVEVRVRSKGGNPSFEALAGEFMNDLLDQRLRLQIAQETEPVRNLIIAHALSRTSLLGSTLEGGAPAAGTAAISLPETQQAAPNKSSFYDPTILAATLTEARVLDIGNISSGEFDDPSTAEGLNQALRQTIEKRSALE